MKEFIMKHLTKIIWGFVLTMVTLGIYALVKIFKN